MKPCRSLLLLALSCSSLLASAAFADPPKDDAVVAVVKKAFLAPLAKREAERSRFSRAAMPPSEKRVRVLQTGVDARGKRFVAFAVDERYFDNEWNEGHTGCVYTDDNAVFVKRGDDFRAAAEFAGQKAQRPAAGTCKAVPQTAGVGPNAAQLPPST